MVGIRNDSGQTITIYPKAGSTINAGSSTVTVATARNERRRFNCRDDRHFCKYERGERYQ